jgi:hypothetical protein
VRVSAPDFRVGVAGGNGPQRWVAEDAERLKIGRVFPPFVKLIVEVIFLSSCPSPHLNVVLSFLVVQVSVLTVFRTIMV